MTDDALAEITALRERLARLEAIATSSTEGVQNMNPIVYTTGADAGSREVRRRRSIASSFVRDPLMERLLGLEARAEAGSMPSAAELAAMSPAVRLSLGHYGSARQAAVDVGLIDATTGESK